MQNKINVTQRFWAISNNKDVSDSLVMDKDGYYQKINKDIEDKSVYIIDRSFRMIDVLSLLKRSGTNFENDQFSIRIPVFNQIFVFSSRQIDRCKLIIVFDIQE